MQNFFRRITRCVWLVLALTACDPQPARPEKAGGRKAQAVIAESMVWQLQTTRIETVGTSRAQQSIVLFPEVAGLVEAVLFRPGERVEAGQTLLQLEAEDEQLAVNAARAFGPC